MTVCLVLLSLSACASRPTADTLTNSIIQSGNASATSDFDDAYVLCIAEYLLASELSDTTLDGLAESFDAAIVLRSEIELVPRILAEANTRCDTSTETQQNTADNNQTAEATTTS